MLRRRTAHAKPIRRLPRPCAPYCDELLSSPHCSSITGQHLWKRNKEGEERRGMRVTTIDFVFFLFFFWCGVFLCVFLVFHCGFFSSSAER